MGMNPDRTIDLADQIEGGTPHFWLLRVFLDADAVRLTLSPGHGEEGIRIPQWALAAFKAAVAAL